MENSFSLSENLILWYDQQGRKDLPWREQITPYRVWISEIMLQQTQVKTVIPYFERFMARFPAVADLANASEDEVLHLWTGLGYYARARNLHRAAKKILVEYASVFPDTLAILQSLPGIGRSTAGAICAIAYNQKAPILDGNVKRVLTRFYAIEGVPSQTKISQLLWSVAENNTPAQRTNDYTQAIMDLGATLCTRTKPSCEICPIASGCQAYRQGRQSTFPTPKPRKTAPTRAIAVLIFHDSKTHQVFLEKRPTVGIWGGLWSFPECPIDADIIQWCDQNLGFQLTQIQTLPTFTHVFTHFKLQITPIYICSYKRKHGIKESQPQIWYDLHKPTERGLSSPVKRLLQNLRGV
jgi:A/G-specific adenine glycosylase